ncbi:MAG TPA: winged helix-turn-helix transcriptional regulator [Streptosporangiaceae bacterium]|nr:winged helix-turn-helix transcriptional regulator [Streptosporangiaceae bacterium]
MFLHLLNGRWTRPILGKLAQAECQYQELLDALEGASRKVLTNTLRRAERDGLIARHLDAERVESAMHRYLAYPTQAASYLAGADEIATITEWVDAGDQLVHDTLTSCGSLRLTLVQRVVAGLQATAPPPP